MINKYSEEIEAMMKKHYDRLSEKDKRSYAAIESYKLGYGGQVYIRKLFGCSADVIIRGMSELQSDEEYESVRLAGGGPKRLVEENSDIMDIFWEIMINHTAGDPMNDELKWTDLSVLDIRQQFKGKGCNVSEYIVKQLLAENKFVKRKAKKEEELKKVPNRNEQFEKIESLIEEYRKTGDPIISVDVKKKKR